MCGYIYKITNTITNKIYIGQRKSQELDESYWGSGRLIKQSIKKYGLDAHNRELIEFCETIDILNEREKYWIKYYNCLTPNGYNIAVGGNQCPVHKLSDAEKQQRSKQLSERNKKNWQNPEYREKMLKICHENGHKTHHTEERKQWLREHPLFAGKKHSEEAKLKMSLAKYKNPSPNQWTSEHNPSKGKHWYTNGVDEVLSESCPDGYTNGMLKRKWCNNGLIQIQIKENEVCPDGFKFGMLKK